MGKKRKGFGAAAALSKVDRRVRSLREFPGVPNGTTGVVIKVDPGIDGYVVAVEWEQEDRRGMDSIDWFTQDEYEEFLVEI